MNKNPSENKQDSARRAAALEAARRSALFLFYSFPFVLILLPPDVYGDGLVALYALLLAAVFVRERLRALRRAEAGLPVRVKERGIIGFIRAGRNPMLRAAVVIPPLGFALFFTGLFAGTLFILWRDRFYIAAGTLAALWLAQRMAPRAKWLGAVRVTLPRAYIALVWISLISYAIFSKTESPEDCSAVEKQPGVRVVYSQKQIDSEPKLKGSFAYMALSTEPQTVLASFKPVSKQAGRVARIDFGDGEKPRVRVIVAPGGGMIQSFAYDPASATMFVPVSRKGDFRMMIIDCTHGRFALQRQTPLPGEPGDAAVDARRRILYAAVKPSRVIAYSLPEMKKLYDVQAPVKGGIDFIAPDERNGRLYVSTVGFHVAAIGARGQRAAKRFMFTSFGLALNSGPKKKLFVASPGMDSLYALDPGTLRTEARLPLRGGVRSVCADPRRDVIYAASYATGRLHIVDTAAAAPRVLRSISAGKVLRRITAGPRDGRILAASSCGIVEAEKR